MKGTTKVIAALAVAVVVGIGVNAMIGSSDSDSNSTGGGLFTLAQAQTATQNTAKGGYVDLTVAAEKSVHAVVHIKSTINSRRIRQQYHDPFEDFFGDLFGAPRGGNRGMREREIETQPRTGVGSGVIISKDGYIVTNNHVVDGADELTITLNDKREFKGKLVGQDASTDLALIKIDEKDLPILTIGNSDAIKVGEWVLAVGNPLNLSSTVTAGIVSAKARGLGAMQGAGGVSTGVESFIQTDAAINQGNSGGALVNARGELIGINAAIISQTGSYSGYGFAIPTSIMQKVVSDLKEYGIVQRAVLGIKGTTNTDERSKEEDLGVRNGVYIDEVSSDQSADDAGLKKGDVITAIDKREVNSMAELQEAIIQHKPGDKVTVTYYRDKKKQTVSVTLKNQQGTTKVVKNVDMELLGAAFKPISEETKRRLSLRNGIEITGIKDGKLKEAGLKQGDIILQVNEQPINSTDDFEAVFKSALVSKTTALFITVINSVGKRSYYAVDLSTDDSK